MAKIRNVKQFKEKVDGAFETMKTRDEAKACYDFSRDEYREAEKEICEYAAVNPAVFDDSDGVSGWGATDTVEYVISGGTTIERADGGKLTDGDFLSKLPKKYLRVKFELNKAKIKAEALDENALAKLGLMRVTTASMKLKAKS